MIMLKHGGLKEKAEKYEGISQSSLWDNCRYSLTRKAFAVSRDRAIFGFSDKTQDESKQPVSLSERVRRPDI